MNPKVLENLIEQTYYESAIKYENRGELNNGISFFKMKLYITQKTDARVYNAFGTVTNNYIDKGKYNLFTNNCRHLTNNFVKAINI